MPVVPLDYPFLPKEMVQAMQPKQDEIAAPTGTDAPDTPVRGRRRGQNRARHLEEDNAHHPSEDR